MKKQGKRILSLLLAMMLVLSGVVVPVDNNTMHANAAEEAVTVSSAEELPAAVEAGTTYELTEDIVLNPGQQITKVAGVLDGKGHTITIADRPLIAEVTGTVQNLIIAGSLTAQADYQGSLVTFLNGGTVRNSASKVDIQLEFFGAGGGIVGRSLNGKVYNSYYAGNVSGELAECAGIIGQSNDESNPSVIKNCYYTGNKAKPVNFGHGYNENDPGYAQKTVEELKQSADLLNVEIQDTGFVWASNGSTLPSLVEAGEPEPEPEPEVVDYTELSLKAKEVKALNKDDYTKETWEVVESALAEAEEILTKQDADQNTVNAARKKLEDAVLALKKPLPTKAVALPSEGVTSVTSVNDLAGIGTGEGKYFRLENDITIKESDYYFVFDTFQGVFDGNGHKIVLENASMGIFCNIGENGVVQNLEVTGTLNGAAPIANTCYGAVINCLSTVTGDTATGLVKRISGGVISNCVTTGKPGKGALVVDYGKDNYETDPVTKYAGKIHNSYWIKGAADPSIASEDLLGGSKALSDKEMQSRSNVTALNAQRGEYGTAWGQSGTTGFPYFGEDQDFNADEEELPESTYTVRFGKSSEDSVLIEEKRLVVSRNDLQTGSSIIGQFFIDGVDSKDIEWSVYDVTEGCIDINKQTGTENNGKLHIYKDGEGIVKAKVKGEDAVWVKVIVDTQAIEDFRLFIKDVDVTGQEYTVQGSEWTSISIKAKSEGEDEYRNVNSSVFSFRYSDNTMVHNVQSADFYFNRPGTAVITVISKEDQSKQASVTVTSEYVPIESIEPDISEHNILHARASMMDGTQFDAIETNGVIILPENASNKKGFDVISKNPEVAQYSATLPLGYLPFSQGEAEFTAFIDDKNPLTGETHRVEGTRKVSFTYKNPLTDIHVNNEKVTVKAYEKAPLNLSFEGELSEEGWSVTEPGLKWTYSTDGIVNITREKLHAQNRDENAPDAERGYWVATTNYEVEGLKPGVVVATGTPIDDTHHVEPVTITIKVENGSQVITDTRKLAETGRNAAGSSIINSHENAGYVFGDEWDVYSLTRAGVALTDAEKDGYYDSAAKVVKKWNKDQKPTDIERVILALAAIGKDVTDVDGVNLEEMLLSSTHLKEGSNELTFALIALKAAGSDVPVEVTDQLLLDLLEFKNEDGGYALFPNGVSGIDTTAMSLQALALYRNTTDKALKEKIETSIKDGLSYIKTHINVVTFDAGNSEATAQTILALTSLGLDPETEKGFSTDRKNLITALMDYYIEGQGFAHTKNKMAVNRMATVQAFQALESFRRFVEGEPAYWELQVEDFKPAPNPEPVPVPEPKPEEEETLLPGITPLAVPENTVNGESLKDKQTKGGQPSKQSEKPSVSEEESTEQAGAVVIGTGEGTLSYSITALEKDADALKKLNLKIVEGSTDKDTEDIIMSLAKDPFMFHFNTDKAFGAEVLVEMNVDKEDGDYLLMKYNDKEMKLELVQKVEVKDNKTKFVVSEGGNYCIAEKATTQTFVTTKESGSSSMPYAAGAVMIALIALAVIYVLSKKRAKKNEK